MQAEPKVQEGLDHVGCQKGVFTVCVCVCERRMGHPKPANQPTRHKDRQAGKDKNTDRETRTRIQTDRERQEKSKDRETDTYIHVFIHTRPSLTYTHTHSITHIHTYIHTYIHAYIYTDRQTNRDTYRRKDSQTDMYRQAHKQIGSFKPTLQQEQNPKHLPFLLQGRRETHNKTLPGKKGYEEDQYSRASGESRGMQMCTLGQLISGCDRTYTHIE